MKIMKLPKLLCYISLIFLTVTSCVSRKNIAYFQDEMTNIQSDSDNNLKIKPDDLLTIRVSAPEQEAALPFNLTKSIGSQDMMMGSVELETYMVSDEGTIEFPILGTIEVEGLTNFELSKKIKDEIVEYVRDPIVNVRVLNFKISVLGEVNSPGTFVVEDDYINLPQALGLAGDLTIFGKRNNILVMREINGQKTKAYLDLTDSRIVSSQFYNLRQNDIIYVEPKGSKRQNAGNLGVAGSYLSIASVLASIIILITN